MADETPAHPPTQPLRERPVQGEGPARTDGRCDQCGYSLVGLPTRGVCPECGSEYTNASALRLKPWPSALMICIRLGWPLIGLALMVGVGNSVQSSNDPVIVTTIFAGWAFALATPINSYFQVRSMLKKSLPEQRRTRGFIAVLRALGTTLCVLVFLGLLAPFLVLAACLVSMSNWH